MNKMNITINGLLAALLKRNRRTVVSRLAKLGLMLVVPPRATSESLRDKLPPATVQLAERVYRLLVADKYLGLFLLADMEKWPVKQLVYHLGAAQAHEFN